MDIRKIPSENGQYIIGSSKDVNNVNPIEYFASSQKKIMASIYFDIIQHELHNIDHNDILKFVHKKVEEEWQARLNEIFNTKVPENIISVLTATSKNDQVRLLKNQALSTNQLTAFIFKAFQEHAYLYSTFSEEHLHNGLTELDLPTLIHLDGKKIKTVGHTKLTDGQLRHLIEYRKVVVAKFLDNGQHWHCLFLTYKSIRGKETWKNGTPHLHYISDKFGMSRQEVENRLKSKFYKLNSLPHIDLTDYKN